jgi:predicted HTH transcriptional regulator
MVKKYLKLLKEQGIIRRAGSNRKGYWEIMEQID